MLFKCPKCGAEISEVRVKYEVSKDAPIDYAGVLVSDVPENYDDGYWESTERQHCPECDADITESISE